MLDYSDDPKICVDGNKGDAEVHVNKETTIGVSTFIIVENHSTCVKNWRLI